MGYTWLVMSEVKGTKEGCVCKPSLCNGLILIYPHPHKRLEKGLVTHLTFCGVSCLDFKLC